MSGISHAPSGRGDPPRLNPNMVGYIRSADRDETLPGRVERHLGLKLHGDHLREGQRTAFRGFFAEVDDTMIGVSRDVHEPLHEWEHNLFRHLERIVLGEVEVPEVGEMSLPDLASDVLRADGFSPNGVLAVALTLERVALDVAERRHVIKPQPSSLFRQPAWTQLQIDVGGGVLIGPVGIVIRHNLPGAITTGLVGRTADVIVAHPALGEYEITAVSTRKKGHTATVRRKGDHPGK